jgi:hypothetical protein
MTSEQISTPYGKKCEILSTFWLNYRDQEGFEDFIEYNDLALPLAFAITENIVESTPVAEVYVLEGWELLCGALGLDAKLNYESIDDMFLEAGKG